MPVHLLNVGTNNGNSSSSGPNAVSKPRGLLTTTPVVIRRPTPRTPAASTLSALFAAPLGKAVSPSHVAALKTTDENIVGRDNMGSPGTAGFPAPTTDTSIVSRREKTKEMINNNFVRPASQSSRKINAEETFLGEKKSAPVSHPVSTMDRLVELPPREPSAKSRNDTGAPTANNVIDLTRWSLVMVPNNPSVTKYERSVTSEWIVLVGKRADMVEMWHSSLITSRRTAREITTGSGRIYRLEGPLDEGAMVEAGFSFDLVENFRSGFPENWKENLLQELSSARGEGLAQRLAKREERSARDKTVNRVDQGRIKRRASLAGTKAPSPKIRKSSHVKQDDSSTDPPYEPTDKHRRKSDPQPRQRPQPYPCTPSSLTKESQRWRDNLTPVVTSEAAILGTTRSGRRVFKPFPYWENKYLGKDLSSPPGKHA